MFISLDIETTGISLENNKIIEIAAVKFDSEKILGEYRSLVNPEMLLSEEVKRITGLTDSDLAFAPNISEIIGKLKNFLGDAIIIGHNIIFDIEFLKQNGLDMRNIFYDTLDLCRIILPSETSYALDILADKLKLKNQPSHRALNDTKTTMELFNVLRRLILDLDGEILNKIKILLSKTLWKYENLFRGTIAV